MKKVRIAIGAAALAAPATLALAPGAAHAATHEVICTTAPHHWLRFASSVGTSSACFGYNGGNWHGDILTVFSQCGGNNVGWYSGGNGNEGFNQTFREGKTWRNIKQEGLVVDISRVHISSWSGSDICPALFP